MIGQAALSVTVRVVGLTLAFAANVLLSRTLGVEEFGTYVIAFGWASLVTIVIRLGLENTMFRYAPIYRERGQNGALAGLVGFTFFATLLAWLAVVGTIIVAWLAGFAPLKKVDPALLAAAVFVAFPLAQVGIFSAFFRTFEKIFESQFYEQLLRPLLLTGFLAGCWLVGRSIDSAFAMRLTLLSLVIAAGLMVARALVLLFALPRERIRFTDRKLWLALSTSLLAMTIVQECLNQLEIILLGLLADNREAALFAAASRFASLAIIGLFAIAGVSAPRIATAFHRGDLDEVAAIARLSARLALMFATMVAVALAFAGPWALRLFGPEFHASYPVLLILLVGALINAATGSVGFLMILTGHERAALKILVGTLAGTALLELFLIPPYGAVGAAIGAAIGIAGWNLAMLVYVRTKLRIDASFVGRSLARD